MVKLKRVRIRCGNCKRSQVYTFHRATPVCVLEAVKIAKSDEDPLFLIRGGFVEHTALCGCSHCVPKMKLLVSEAFLCKCGTVFNTRRANCPHCSKSVRNKITSLTNIRKYSGAPDQPAKFKSMYQAFEEAENNPSSGFEHQFVDTVMRVCKHADQFMK